MSRASTRAATLSGLFAVLLTLVVPLTAGASRDDHLALLGVVLAALLAVAALTSSAPSSPGMAGVQLASMLGLLAVAASDLLSPYVDSAWRNLVVEAVACGCFLLGLSLGAEDRRAPRMFLDAALAGSLAVGIVSLLKSEGALSWPFRNHGQLGGLLAAGVFCGVAGARSHRHSKSGPRGRIAELLSGPVLGRLAAAALLSVLVAQTGSRSSMVALVVLFLILLLVRGEMSPRTRLAGMAVLLSFCFMVAVWVGTARRWGPEQIQSGSVQERVEVWRASLRLFEQSPMTGVGSGAFGSAVWGVAPSNLGGSIEHAHSAPLEFAAERGLVGLFSLLCVVGAVYASLGSPGRTRASVAREGALLPAAVLLLQASIDLVLTTPGLLALAFACLGLACGGVLRVLPWNDPASRWPARAGLLLAAAGIGITAGRWGVVSFHRARSDASLEAGETGRALASARRSVDQFPADRVSLRRLAEAGETGRFQQLAALDPQDPYVALGAAWELEQEGRDEEAEGYLRRARADFPAAFEGRRALLEFLIRHGRLGDAMQAVAELESSFPMRVAEEVVQLAESTRNPLLAVDLAPADPIQRRAVALWVLDHGEPAGARQLLSTTSEDASPERALLLARIAVASGDPQEAKRVLLDLLHREPGSGEAASTYADLASSAAERTEAAAVLSAAFERKPCPPCAARLIGLLDADAGRAEADRWLGKEIDSQPDQTGLLLLRLARREGAGDLAGAMADARRIIDLTPHDPQGRLVLAGLYERRGMRAGARELYLEVTRMQPENVGAREGLKRTEPVPPH